MKCFKKEGSWKFLASCYITFAREYHCFNSPLRSKLSIYKAKMVIRKHGVTGLDENLESVDSMPFLGSHRD